MGLGSVCEGGVSIAKEGLVVKVVGFTVFRGVLALSLANLGVFSASGGEPEEDISEMVVEESAGGWVVERFAGNSTAGPEFFQGPAREVGGLGRCRAVPTPDGTVYVAFSQGIAEVSPDGMLRLVLGQGGQMKGSWDIGWLSGQLRLAAYNPKEKCLYLIGPNCVCRLVKKADGAQSLEVVAGTPNQPGFVDGPAKSATFTRAEHVVINSKGTVYLLDAGERLRRIENGEVTTLNSNFRSGQLRDGPLAEACFNLIGLGGGISLGENDDTLYVADHWNFRVRKIDLRTMTVTTVAGMPKPEEWRPEKQTPVEKRYNRNSDGPALTHASFNSGCTYVCWDPVRKALWCGGPDESRFRWLKDGWVRTMIGSKGTDKWPRDGFNVPAEQVKLVWNEVVAVDSLGRVYLAASSDPSGIWRAYNTKGLGQW